MAILDIDEVIQLIRTSDNSEEARGRLMAVFDLTEPQATYILDMQLRRLTRFSKIELDKEKSELERTIEELDAILGDEALLRRVVSDELSDVAKTYGTPRRTVLLESAGTPVTATAAALEVPDDPCFALMSGPPGCSPAPATPTRSAAVATAPTTTSSSRPWRPPRVVRSACSPRPADCSASASSTCPRSRPRPTTPTSRAGSRSARSSSSAPASAHWRSARWPPTVRAWPWAPAHGVVKRVNPEVLGRDEWEVIGLKDDDQVVGAVELTTGAETLCFISTDAQLLHFAAASVRPQGRAGGGMAGIKLDPAHAASGSAPLDPRTRRSVVVTASGSSTALPGTEPGSVKVTPFTEYPAKGRATGGVRCHRFLKGEDTLVFAWAGTAPARASAASGSPVDLPDADGRRDGSGTPGSQPIAACAGPVTVAAAAEPLHRCARVTA